MLSTIFGKMKIFHAERVVFAITSWALDGVPKSGKVIPYPRGALGASLRTVAIEIFVTNFSAKAEPSDQLKSLLA